MSQYTVITRGYGSFGSVNLVITKGFTSGVGTPFPLYITLSESLEYGIVTTTTAGGT